MNRYNFINGPMPKREFVKPIKMHQCDHFDIDYNDTIPVRCQTMLSEGSPDYCPQHQLMRNIQRIEDIISRGEPNRMEEDNE